MRPSDARPTDGAAVVLRAGGSPVCLGAGVFQGLWDQVRAHVPAAARVGVALDHTVASLWPLPEPPAGLDVLPVHLPPGEAAKTRAVLGTLQDAWIGLRRDEPVVAIGGGATLDVAGLAAATLRRGLPWVAVPTTVVGMADAAIGGKTAVNHPQGKNLLGAFHVPSLVLIDPAFLATLPPRDLRAGLAEVYKVARLGAPGLLAALRSGVPTTDRAWIEVLTRTVTFKGALVDVDLRDGASRRLLNYGHTVGHALETLLGNETLRHGEAVAIGMDVAAHLSVARGLLTEAACAGQRADLEALGLAPRPEDAPDGARVLEVLSRDKKRGAGRSHTFILPEGACGAGVYEDVRDVEILDALRAAWV